MNDLISRQAAMVVFENSGLDDDSKDTVVRVLEALPSAQPECKDCIMHGICRFERGLGLDGYCSQAERREEWAE